MDETTKVAFLGGICSIATQPIAQMANILGLVQVRRMSRHSGTVINLASEKLPNLRKKINLFIGR